MTYFRKILILFLFTFASAYAQFGMNQDLVKIKTFNSLDKVYAGSEFKVAVKINIDSTWHINSDKPYEDYLIPTELTIEGDERFKLNQVAYPEAHDFNLSFSETPLSVWEGEVFAGALIEVSDEVEPGIYSIIINLDYQACNDITCLAPTVVQDTLIVEVADRQAIVNQVNQDIFENVDLAFTASVSQTVERDVITSALEESGLLLALVFVFLGGLALNLTPCVYPLIPITIGYFGWQSEGSTGKLFTLGLLFVLGMAITYSAIGVITALSGALFGALLQNPIVIIIIAAIFVALSLSMFGLYEFQLPSGLVAKAGGAKSGLFGALFMGLTMGIVAAPCIGPFVIGLVTYVAAKGDPYFGLLLFFVLALGLGFPYLFLAVFSGKIKSLPRAGEWMDAVKHVFGFILIAMALYFLLPLLPKSISGYVLPVYMLLVGIYLLVFEKLANKILGFRIFKIVFSVLIMAIAVYAISPTDQNSVEWTPYSDEALTQLNDKHRGVIIDFYADWCIPCKELDALTFTDQRVIDESKSFITLKADMTKSLAPEVEMLREKYNILGVPTVLIIDNSGVERQRITGFVNADEFLELMKVVN